MSFLHHHGESTRFYRRGAIMGLTVAETFMLLVFALLLLLLLWRNELLAFVQIPHSERQKLVELMATDGFAESIEHQRALLQAVDNTEELKESSAIAQKAAQLTPDERQELAELMSTRGFAESIKHHRALLQAVDNTEELRESQAIAQKAAQLTPDERRELAEFMSTRGFAESIQHQRALLQAVDNTEELSESQAIAQKAAQLTPDERRELAELMSTRRFSESIKHQRALLQAVDNTEELRESSAIAQKAAQLNPQGRQELSNILDSGHSLEDVRTALDSQANISNKVSNQISREVGEVVQRFGGQIGQDGVITVPNQRSFELGQASLTEEFREFLDEFCPHYLQTLRDYSDNIQDVRVEGHASSEWRTTASEHQRFMNNLDLSQKRAFSVLEYCLSALRDPELWRWASQKITAVGFSSARPIYKADQTTEDKDLSRRFAFSYIVNYSQPDGNPSPSP